MKVQVLLVHAPGANPREPSLACGLLQAVLQEAGVRCGTFYASLNTGGPGDAPGHDDGIGRLCSGANWAGHGIAWFPLAPEQLLAAIRMARWIRANAPGIRIMFSGGWLAGESPADADLVVTGDPEAVAPAVVGALTEGWPLPDLTAVVPELNRLPLPDYRPFFEQGAVSGVAPHTAVLPVELARGRRTKTADRVVSEVLALAGRHQVTAFRIGDGSLDLSLADAVLPALAKAQRENSFQFSFTCDLGAPVTRGQARLLKRAGVLNVRLQLNAPGLAPTWVQTLKVLAEVGIAVKWDLPEGAAGEPALYHLPPPEPGMGVEEPWRRNHRSARLTYSPGPGVVRIYDRRDASRGGRLITLVGLQAQVFLSCEEARPFDQLAEQFCNYAAPETLRRFLDELVGRQLMLRTADGRYLTLPIQRKLEEVEISV